MTTTTFDEYSNWHDSSTFGLEAVRKTYRRPDRAEECFVLTEELEQTVRESVLQNMVQPALVNTGDQVTSETQIGKVGTTGTSSGNHLHFGLMKGLPGEELSYVDPMPYIN
jgi:hypothetical protein